MQVLLSINWYLNESGSARRAREATVRSRLEKAGISFTLKPSCGFGSNQYIIDGIDVPKCIKRLVYLVGYLSNGEFLLRSEYMQT